MPTDTSDFVLTTIIRFVGAGFVSVIGAVGIGLFVGLIIDDIIGFYASFISTIIIFTVIIVTMYKPAKEKKE